MSAAYISLLASFPSPFIGDWGGVEMIGADFRNISIEARLCLGTWKVKLQNYQRIVIFYVSIEHIMRSRPKFVLNPRAKIYSDPQRVRIPISQ